MVAMNMNTNTYTLSASTSSSAVTLLDQDANQTSVVAKNTGSVPVFIVSGKTSAPTAVFPTSATVPVQGKVIGAGNTETYTKNATDNFISGITASGTASVYISPGAGE